MFYAADNIVWNLTKNCHIFIAVGQGALGFASDEYDQNKSTIVTKTAAVQKSSIPQIHDAEYVNEGILDFINTYFFLCAKLN